MALAPVAAIPVWVPFLAAVVTLDLIADVISKEFSLHGGSWRMALAASFVVAGNLTWQFMLRTSGVGLARAGLLFAVGVAVGATLIGVFGYGEGLTDKQKIGAVLGVLVLLLLG
ncbi:MAG: hypothetical protein KGQ75_17320 [Sphingomonadales bacterium]|uniref:hypothetical protein n=1 Tax=Novosphingobium sp. AAP93 TaxID=1523427 RepID=UPI0006B960E6|nr:hypothetical protein [Novosphingobium sp. AAP93]KPF89680.1 hypothetical protein IP83_01635 [Novosphingobium sp. AAP93]MBU6396333.1 hypothetical protein [Sphingomonadales bacterium]MBY0392032.1 hypothetical protein [Novosphingobium sp.]